MKAFVNASIITIGDELLIGQVVDTNSAWIANELNKIGIWLKRRVAVGDQREDIKRALDDESAHSSIVIITGGLGPTADDITKPVLCEYFGGKMIVDQAVSDHIRNLFENVYKRPFSERNAKQAEVPDCCRVLTNLNGTAPGMLFEKNDTVFISLPGVPHEMKGLMTNIVIPELAEKYVSGHIIHRTLLTSGIGESFLADKIIEVENSLPDFIRLAYLPGYGMVRLRLTAKGTDKDVLNKEIEHYFNRLLELTKEWLVADEDITLPQALSKLLKEKKKFIGTAESCTGGYIAHMLTRESGASDKYKGTIVSYSNEIKQNILKVKEKTLKTFGAVSEETIREMVAGTLLALDVDYALCTSGIMGPDGGTPDKPVGTVWIGVGNKDKIIAKKLHFRFDRLRNIELTTNAALDIARKFIEESEN